MKKYIVIMSLALVLVACSGDDEQDDTNAVETPSVPVTNQIDDDVVETLQEAVDTSAVEAEQVAELEQASEKAGVVDQLKSMTTAVTNKTAELVDDAKSMGQEALDSSKKMGETVVEKTESVVDSVKKVSQGAIDKSKEVGAAVATQTSEAVQSVKKTGSDILNKGKTTFYGSAADETSVTSEAVQSVKKTGSDILNKGKTTFYGSAADETSVEPDPDDQVMDEETMQTVPSSDDATTVTDEQNTQAVPKSMTQKSLSELVRRLEVALASMEQAASQAKQAAADLSQGMAASE